MQNLLNWVSNWYQQQCNGDWEHVHGISIKNLDNPGWELKVDLEDTDLDGLILPYQLHEHENGEWYGYKTENNKFEAFGSSLLLEQLLFTFKMFAEGDLKHLCLQPNASSL